MRKVEQKIESCSQQDVELHIERVGIVSLQSSVHVNTEQIVQSLFMHTNSSLHLNENLDVEKNIHFAHEHASYHSAR